MPTEVLRSLGRASWHQPDEGEGVRTAGFAGAMEVRGGAARGGLDMNQGSVRRIGHAQSHREALMILPTLLFYVLWRFAQIKASLTHPNFPLLDL